MPLSRVDILATLPEDLDQANRAFGLTETTAGTDGEWGLTTTQQAAAAVAGG